MDASQGRIQSGAQAILLRVRQSPALAAAAAASMLVLSPFLAAATVILSIGVLCCVPVVLTAGTIGAVVWFGPRVSEFARFWSVEAIHLASRARASPMGIQLESSLKANPLLAAGTLCCTPVLIPAGLLAAATVFAILVVSLPLLVPGICIALANHEFRTMAWGVTQRAAARVVGALDWQAAPAASRGTPSVQAQPQVRERSGMEPRSPWPASAISTAAAPAQAPMWSAPAQSGSHAECPPAGERPGEEHETMAEPLALVADELMAESQPALSPKTVAAPPKATSSTPPRNLSPLPQPQGQVSPSDVPRSRSPVSTASEVSSTTPIERKRAPKARSKKSSGAFAQPQSLGSG